jgi:hypothetical protein
VSINRVRSNHNNRSSRSNSNRDRSSRFRAGGVVVAAAERAAIHPLRHNRNNGRPVRRKFRSNNSRTRNLPPEATTIVEAAAVAVDSADAGARVVMVAEIRRRRRSVPSLS